MCIICVESATCIHNSSKAVPKEQFSMCVQLTWYLIFSKTICKKTNVLAKCEDFVHCCNLELKQIFFFVAVDFNFTVTDCLRLTVDFVFVEKKRRFFHCRNHDWVRSINYTVFSASFGRNIFPNVLYIIPACCVLFVCLFFYFLLCWWKCVDNMLYS